METANILTVIEEKLPHLSKNHKKIASFILNHFEKAVFMTAAEIAKEIGISESTVVRFAYALDMEGFPAFQKKLAECVKDRLSGKETETYFYGRSKSEILTTVMKSDIDKIRNTIENLNADAFDLAVETILSAKNVYVMGLRSNEPLARFLHFYLNIIRRNVILLSTNSISETFEQMMYIDEKDCFIGISFPRYSLRTLKAMELANDRTAKVIAITDSIYSPMNIYSSCNLCAKSDMISMIDSLVAPLSVINALLVSLVLKCPGEVRANMKILEDAWNNYQVYLNDEISFTGADPETIKPLENPAQEEKTAEES